MIDKEMAITLDYNGKDIEARFPYHPRLVSVMQISIPGRRWNGKKKCWLLPANEITAKWIEQFNLLFPDIKLIQKASVKKFLTGRKEKSEICETIKGKITDPLKSVDQAEYKLKPYNHQFEALRYIVRRSQGKIPYAGLFYEMGTGKTKIVVDSSRILNWKKILIIIPKTIGVSWKKEIAKNLDKPYRIIDATKGTTRKRAELIADSLNYQKYNGRSFVLVNYDAIRIKAMFEVLNSIEWDAMILDESTYVKTPKAQRTKAAIRLGQAAGFRMVMTGTPITNNYLDLYAQLKFLDPSILGIPTYTAFKATYAILGGFEQKQVVGFKNVEDLLEKVKNHSLICMIDDCLDLPEKMPPIIRSVSLDDYPEVKAAYNNMRKSLMHEFDDGNITTAKNVLTKLLRLQQITSGFLTDDEGNINSFGQSPKITALLEFINEIADDESVVIWARFLHDIDEIERAISPYGKVGKITGSITGEDRDKIINDFEDGKIRFLVATPRTCGFGINLVSARYTIWYSSSFSLEERYQADARTYRSGQKRRTFFIDLVCENTIDELILTAISKKSDLLDYVMSSSKRIEKAIPEL